MILKEIFVSLSPDHHILTKMFQKKQFFPCHPRHFRSGFQVIPRLQRHLEMCLTFYKRPQHLKFGTNLHYS
jgi:hypothetical protein